MSDNTLRNNVIAISIKSNNKFYRYKVSCFSLINSSIKLYPLEGKPFVIKLDKFNDELEIRGIRRQINF